MKNIKTILETRIAELNKADSEYCKERWDMSNSESQRAMAREFSNRATYARQELQQILKEVEKLLPAKTDEKFNPFLVPDHGGFQIKIYENLVLPPGTAYMFLSPSDYKNYSEKIKNINPST